MASILNVTELDFDQIKENLKTYLKNQDGFTDYDFDGSGLNILLDLLSYNTHYNALNAHFGLNEAFLDSAQIRGNVVTRAKLLGYIPRSTLSPRARVNIVITAGDVNPTTLTLKRGTKFTTVIDNNEYTFVTLSERLASNDNDTYTFEDVEIVEGNLKKLYYTVNNIIPNQKFQLPDTDIDTSTLNVKIKLNTASLNSETYSVYENISKVTSTSQVYWLQQNANEYYEIYFGDNITGKKPVTGNLVEIEYVHTNGEAANSANTFTLASTILSGSTNVVTTLNTATGGQPRETLESVRFNAPLKFAAQGRAVSADDYRSIIKADYSNVDAISVWGGENNDDPDYGKVYVAIKPLTGKSLTDDEKDVIYGILKGKTVTSITPVIVDIEYTYLALDVDIRYNPNLTGKTNNELVTAVNNTISNYGANKLNDFDGVFRHSQIVAAIDRTDPSILSSTVRPKMFKSIALNTTSNDVLLSFAQPIYSGGNTKDMNISSSSFKYQGQTCYIGDVEITGSVKRSVVVFKYDKLSRPVALKKVGEMDFDKGTISISGFVPDEETTIRVTVIPDSLDIAPKRAQLVSIDTNYSNITAQIDTISTSGQSGAINYKTTPRLK